MTRGLSSIVGNAEPPWDASAQMRTRVMRRDRRCCWAGGCCGCRGVHPQPLETAQGRVADARRVRVHGVRRWWEVRLRVERATGLGDRQDHPGDRGRRARRGRRDARRAVRRRAVGHRLRPGGIPCDQGLGRSPCRIGACDRAAHLVIGHPSVNVGYCPISSAGSRIHNRERLVCQVAGPRLEAAAAMASSQPIHRFRCLTSSRGWAGAGFCS
jgi:hypothetical protein